MANETTTTIHAGLAVLVAVAMEIRDSKKHANEGEPPTDLYLAGAVQAIARAYSHIADTDEKSDV
jgi:hypothetical protein